MKAPSVDSMWLVNSMANSRFATNALKKNTSNAESRIRRRTSALRYVAMRFFDAVPCFGEALSDLAGHHHRTVMPARTSDTDRQVALPFALVMGQQVQQHVRYAFDEFYCLREGADVTRDARMPSGQVLELRDVVRIRQESYIKHQIAVIRDTVAEPKAGHIDENVFAGSAAFEVLGDDIAQFVDGELGCIDGVVGQGADRLQFLALMLQALHHRLAGAKRVRPARLAETPRKRFVGSFQEHEAYRKFPPQFPVHGQKALQ